MKAGQVFMTVAINEKEGLTTTSERTGDDDLKLLCGRASLKWDHTHYLKLQSPE